MSCSTDRFTLCLGKEGYLTVRALCDVLAKFDRDANINVGECTCFRRFRFFNTKGPVWTDCHPREDEDWDSVEFRYDGGLTQGKVGTVLDVLNRCAREHGDSIVTITESEAVALVERDSSSGDVRLGTWVRKIHNTDLNPYRDVEALVNALNESKARDALKALDLLKKKAKTPMAAAHVRDLVLYRIGDRWFSESQLEDAFPRLRKHPNWDKLFEAMLSPRVGQLYDCVVPEVEMERHFGRKPSVIDALLKKYKPTTSRDDDHEKKKMVTDRPTNVPLD